MSQAFRDTFKQTFCICQAVQTHQSPVSFSTIKKRRFRQDSFNQSIAYEAIAVCKYSNNGRLNSSPLIENLPDRQNKISSHCSPKSSSFSL